MTTYFKTFNFEYELREIFIEPFEDEEDNKDVSIEDPTLAIPILSRSNLFDNGTKYYHEFLADKENIDSLYKSFLNYRDSLLRDSDYGNDDAFSKEEYLFAKTFILSKCVELNKVIKKEHDKYYEYRYQIISFILKIYPDLIIGQKKYTKVVTWFENLFPSIDWFFRGGYDELLLETLFLLESYDEKNEEKVEFFDEKIISPEDVYWVFLPNYQQDTKKVRQAITEIINRLLTSNFDKIRKKASLAFLINEQINNEEEKTLKYYKEKFGFITHSRKMLNFLRQVDKYAPTNASISIRGDTGTGKEIVAKMIVEKSNRKGKPFVIENCGGLPPNLIESRLFGHKKGGFTGAVSDRQGLFSVADGGTVFLDEIGDMPIDVQVKLLRVLESGEYYRVGDPNPSKTDVRVISATNKDVEKAISKGEFRKDLYFRLNMAELYIPSLDEDKYKGPNRSADISYLCYHYFKMYVEEQGPADWVYLKDKHDITPEYFSLFMLKEWPGNVRGIKRHMWRAFIEIKGMIRSVPKDILYEILENPGKDWELQTGIQDESKKSSIFRDDKFEEALRSFIFCNYNYSHVQKELNIGDWATVRNHINSAFLALGHHTVFNLDSFKDVLIEYGIKAESEELRKAANESFKDIIKCKLSGKTKIHYEKADEKYGYIGELFNALPKMVKSIKSQLK